MPLVTSKEMLQKAYREGYAVGAFNINSMEALRGITAAAKKLNAPVIIQVLESVYLRLGPTYLKKLIEAAVDETGLPICLHLDHGSSYKICKECIDHGFTSVMIDGSHLPLTENIILTKSVVNYAHAHGIDVEAELGSISGSEELQAINYTAAYTSPDEAAEFVKETGCDSLAISIGTSHGAYKFRPGTNPELRIDILDEVSERIPGVPIVLHGASSVPQDAVRKINQYGGEISNAIGIPESQLRVAAQKAVCKINVCTDQLITMTGCVREALATHPDQFNSDCYLVPAEAEIEKLVSGKILNILGCAGKAE